jgi:N-formylglutamate amidohydrolase
VRDDPAERCQLNPVFDYAEGGSALVVSIPHDGRLLMPGQETAMTAAGRALPDTDWHVRRLYDFVDELNATVIAANYSRYVVDLNRSAEDDALYLGRVSTGLCPASTFAGDALYVDGAPISATEQARRVALYWRPYHDKLRAVLRERVAQFGKVLLWDAHSIAGEVPRLFEGTLPELNIGSNAGLSCVPEVSAAVHAVAESSRYSCVLNGRFKGGYITRHYGDPAAGVHAVQLEIAQRSYMDEESGEYLAEAAGNLQKVIKNMLLAALHSISSSQGTAVD